MIQVKIKNKYFEVCEKVEEYKKGKAYLIDNILYAFYGTASKKDNLAPGIYLDEKENKFFIVKYEKGEEVTINKTINSKVNISSLLEEIKNLPKEVLSSEKEDVDKNHETSKFKNASLLKYEISLKDDDMVRLIKEIINEKDISMQDVYDKMKNNNEGYNLIYGLRKRSTITYDSFCKWAEILNMDVEIKLVDKEGI